MDEDDELEYQEQLQGRLGAVDDLIKELETHVRSAEEKNKEIASQSTEAAKILEQIDEQKEESSELKLNIYEELENSKEHSAKLIEFSKTIAALEANEELMLGRLERTMSRCEAQEKVIENLLPGATSAGLASAFKERKESFAVPKVIWGLVFVFSMLGLILVAYYDPISWEKTSVPSGELFHYLFSRLPFAIPIVWLAIYAGRRHGQALRLEEDYAHKEVLSKSFEGYKRQLLDIEEESESKESTISLINQTLYALAVHPGRIYAGKHEDITLLNLLPGILSVGKKEKTQDEKDA